MTIRGVLFDAGDTLTRPIGGRWNPRFDFEEVLIRHVPDAPSSRFAEAFTAGEQFLEKSPATPPRDDYHRAILAELGIENPSRALLDDLERPLDVPHVEPFPDVPAVLEELRARTIGMAVVTDNWGDAGTVKQKHDRIGLEGFFEAFVVSAELGCTKPDARMYHTASDALGLEPAECFYVDDDPALVAAALALGYSGAAICRNESPPPSEVRVISRLDELLPLIADPQPCDLDGRS